MSDLINYNFMLKAFPKTDNLNECIYLLRHCSGHIAQKASKQAKRHSNTDEAHILAHIYFPIIYYLLSH